MADKKTEKVVIIGAGIVGICTALSLLEKGFAVELIDRADPASGASHGNAGVISPWSCVPQSMPGVWRNVPKWLLQKEGPLAIRWGYAPRLLPWIIEFFRSGTSERLPGIADAMQALSRPNIELYRNHLDGTGKEHLVSDCLYVHVFRNPENADLSQLAWRMRKERGVPLQRVNEEELHEIEPALSRDYKAAILIKGQARALDPGAIGTALFDKAVSMGAIIRRTEVHSIKPGQDSGWSLQTDAGELVCDKLVIAAGAWSARLLTPLGLKLPLEAERGYHLMFRDPGITLNNSIMDVENKFVVSSMALGVRCAGTAEFAGLDAAPDYNRAMVFKTMARRLFPQLNVDDTDAWMGTRPSFPDSLPCLGEIPGQAGLFAAFGHSHFGFGMAPNSGRIVANIVSGEPTSINM